MKLIALVFSTVLLFACTTIRVDNAKQYGRMKYQEGKLSAYEKMFETNKDMGVVIKDLHNQQKQILEDLYPELEKNNNELDKVK